MDLVHSLSFLILLMLFNKFLNLYLHHYSFLHLTAIATAHHYISRYKLLGGLSLHLNHLIGSRVTNYDWPFGTLPFGLFGSNLDTRDLETYPRTYSGRF